MTVMVTMAAMIKREIITMAPIRTLVGGAAAPKVYAGKGISSSGLMLPLVQAVHKAPLVYIQAQC